MRRGPPCSIFAQRFRGSDNTCVVKSPGTCICAGDVVTVDLIRALIAGYKIPRTVEIRHETLPKSGAGKLLKHVLREPFWPDHERRLG
jgi:acyl-CoA synthetase (AMP-forming)/AMP-acid ligase II